MVGLEYLCSLNNITYAQLSRELGISRQSVAAWLNGSRKIPQKHYTKLKEIFDVSEEYFNKELTELDKLKIQKLKLEEEIVEYKYSSVNYDDETNEKYEIEDVAYLMPDELGEINFKIEQKNLLAKIDNYINEKNLKDENEMNDEAYYIMKAFNSFYQVIKKDNIDIKIIIDILSGIKMAQGTAFDTKVFVRKIASIVKEQVILNKKRK
ncbi:helix-turn-helix domain-containing protein [Eubacterium multiforme]|uniref:Transcriptional regulator with XRE-family HTH domain n=1 Tax=Eubacterium multiforme TaxID=83339 RepID=A0ABT9USF7_9FIRM|nr:helix-turn-helix transcriptional regulator [Eubacterium multiforme]MDQ0149235.1 transcriptional regulator with XRE-family HTH domain [Eubacterium multiforme]